MSLFKKATPNGAKTNAQLQSTAAGLGAKFSRYFLNATAFAAFIITFEVISPDGRKPDGKFHMQEALGFYGGEVKRITVFDSVQINNVCGISPYPPALQIAYRLGMDGARHMDSIKTITINGADTVVVDWVSNLR